MIFMKYTTLYIYVQQLKKCFSDMHEFSIYTQISSLQWQIDMLKITI